MAEGPRRRGGPGRRSKARRGAGPTGARLLALRVLDRVEQAHAYADVTLHAAFARTPLTVRDRALATELVYGTLRWRGRIDFLLGSLLERELERLEPPVRAALRLGAYQLAFSDRIPATAAVDESVRCVRAVGYDRATGLVNAVLRRFAAEHPGIPLPALEEDPLGHLMHALSLPSWIAERWIDLYGAADAAALARASNEVPPQAVRANPRHGSRDRLLAELKERFPEAEACRYAPDGIMLGAHGSPLQDAAFLAGHYTVQDEASQLVVELLDPAPGERILDVCAAPGGKATAIAERVGPSGEVVALDKNGRRLALLERDARRLGLENLRPVEGDATAAVPDPGPDLYDRILVDAPCSGLGTLRRNPDARWRVRPEDPARLASLQAAILGRAARFLRRGGVLVYSTCTLLPEENEGVIRGFLDDFRDFRPATVSELTPAIRPLVDPEAVMRTLPHRHGTDGFVATRLERTP